MGRANLILITAHDLGRHLGCYGRDAVVSPAVDVLSDCGVRFENAFCTAPFCSPSRAALHTGYYPHSTGVLGLAHGSFGWRLTPATRHIAHLLRDAGYQTVLAGLQHVTDRPDELGFDRMLLPRCPVKELSANVTGLLPDLAADSRPFYLEVGIFEPHRPWGYGGVTPDTSRGVEIPSYLPESDEARIEVAALQGAIRAMDEGVGTILDTLRRLGLEDDTCVVFTTDHGLALPRAKSTLYDPGIEGALIVRWPAAGLMGGRTYPELISNVDVVPTLLDALGIPLLPGVQGESLWPLLQGGTYAARSEVFAEKTFHTGYEPMRCVRTRTHKLIVNFEVSNTVDVPTDIRQGILYPSLAATFAGPRSHTELYDLRTDPGETVNLAGCSELADIQADLRNGLLAWMRQTADPLLDGPVMSPFYRDSIAVLTGRLGDAGHSPTPAT